MKASLSKTQTQEKINHFSNQQTFTPEQVKKIKRLAMKHKIRLGPLRKKFCKKCFSQLKGKTRTTKTHKIIECNKCQYKNKFKH
jgi:RNase P subunit RPR2